MNIYLVIDCRNGNLEIAETSQSRLVDAVGTLGRRFGHVLPEDLSPMIAVAGLNKLAGTAFVLNVVKTVGNKVLEFGPIAVSDELQGIFGRENFSLNSPP